jgi:hypothetical protein
MGGLSRQKQTNSLLGNYKKKFCSKLFFAGVLEKRSRFSSVYPEFES